MGKSPTSFQTSYPMIFLHGGHFNIVLYNWSTAVKLFLYHDLFIMNIKKFHCGLSKILFIRRKKIHFNSGSPILLCKVHNPKNSFSAENQFYKTMFNWPPCTIRNTICTLLYVYVFIYVYLINGSLHTQPLNFYFLNITKYGD